MIYFSHRSLGKSSLWLLSFVKKHYNKHFIDCKEEMMWKAFSRHTNINLVTMHLCCDLTKKSCEFEWT